MQLITKTIENKLKKRPLCSQEGNENPDIVVKFFNPCGIGTWYITEGEKQPDGDCFCSACAACKRLNWATSCCQNLKNCACHSVCQSSGTFATLANLQTREKNPNIGATAKN